MARSISPFFIHSLPRATYDFAESAREVCAAAPQDVSSASIAVRRMRRVIRSRVVESSQTGASADIAFFIMPPSTTKATISVTTRHGAEFFPLAQVALQIAGRCDRRGSKKGKKGKTR